MATSILEHPLVYRLWQFPFAADKLEPLLARNDLSQARRVLDVGCGPGTNTARFAHAEYVGIDINPQYVAWARRRYGREFVVADIREHKFGTGEKFDFVLVNSFLHHVDDAETERILDGVARALAPEGFVHILDLVLPERSSVARWLARHDRGRYARGVEAWRALFGRSFDIVSFEPYAVGFPGVALWNMIYCKGRAMR